MIDQLKSIGIEKGKPFDPDARTQDILKAAAREAHAFLEIGYEGVFTPPLSTAPVDASGVARGIRRHRKTAYRSERGSFDGRGVSYFMPSSAPSISATASSI